MPLCLLLLVAGCNQAAKSVEGVMLQLRTIMVAEDDPENQPATNANRAIKILGGLPFKELLALAESTDANSVLRKLDAHRNFNIMRQIRSLHATDDGVVMDIVARVAKLPMGGDGDPTEPLAARVVVLVMQALG